MMNRGLRRELSLLSGLAGLGMLLLNRRQLALALGVGAAALRLLPNAKTSYGGKSVIITGGSRGLGLALASQFLEEGAMVTLLARDEKELDRARFLLKQKLQGKINLSGCLNTQVCDVTDESALMKAFRQVEDRFHRIDVLVNNAGTITVGPHDAMESKDFSSMLDLQVHAVVSAVELAVPAFCRVGGGTIINISSIGGQLPVPHMSTYCTGKFALAGLSETLASELGPRGIQVTTVYPGMMRTGSPIQAVFKGDTQKEYAWFATGNLIPGLSVSAEEAARHIVEGARNGDLRVVFPLSTKLGIWGYRLFPETYALTMRTVARLMPPLGSNNPTERLTGAESKQWMESQPWYKWNPALKNSNENARRKGNQAERYNAEFNLGIEPSTN